jgi:hypothetical protein
MFPVVFGEVLMDVEVEVEVEGEVEVVVNEM